MLFVDVKYEKMYDASQDGNCRMRSLAHHVIRAFCKNPQSFTLELKLMTISIDEFFIIITKEKPLKFWLNMMVLISISMKTGCISNWILRSNWIPRTTWIVLVGSSNATLDE